MAKCSYCGQRKGKRPCPALSGDICSPCCGKHRALDIDCPPDCRFLDGGGSHRTSREVTDRLMDRMLRFASRRGELGKEAMVAFLGPGRELEEWQQAAAIHHMFFCHHGADGKTMAEHFQREQDGKLHPSERDALTAYMQARFSLFEVREIRLGKGLLLRDLLLGDDTFVSDRSATHDVRRLDLLLAWVMRRNGRHELSTSPTRIPRLHREAVLSTMRESMEEAGAARPGTSDEILLQETVVVAHQTLSTLIREQQPPQIRTSDGEEILFCKAVYDLGDPVAVGVTLSGHPDLDEFDDGTYDWIDPRGRPMLGDGPLSLGSIRVEKDRLVLETKSRERLEKGKAFISRLLGDLVQHRIDSYEDLEMAKSRLADAPPKEREEIPPEVEAELLSKFMQEHLATWLDMELPLLGGQTPRQAVRSQRGREQVLAMLRDQEHIYAGRPGADRVDWTAPYRELGLDYDE